MSYWRMRRQTELFKKMVGQKFKDVSDELIDAEDAVIKKKGEVGRLKLEKAPDAIISQGLAALANLEYRYRQLMVQFEKTPLK